MRKLFLFLAAMMLSIAVNAATAWNITNNEENILFTFISSDIVQDGDTIVMAKGTYTEGTSSDLNLAKSLVIKAADGDTVIIQPQLPILFKGGARVEFIGIMFDAINLRKRATWVENLILSYDATEGKKLIFDGCEFYNDTINAPIIYCASGNKLDSCIINDCKIHDIKKSFVFLENSGLIGLSVTNSTFADISTASSYGAGIIDPRSSSATTLVDHCTFYNCLPNASDRGIIRVASSTDVVVSNCIFTMPSSTAVRAICIKGGNIKNCLLTNFSKGTHGIHTDSPWAPTITSCIYEEDPLFADAANGNFSLAKNSPAFEAGVGKTHLGDPRWWHEDWEVAATVDVTSIELSAEVLTLDVNETAYLTATVLPANASDPSVTWTSSAPAVATVVAGAVKGISAGTATITATAGGKSATCEVTVSADLPSTDFATPYVCLPTKAILENRVSLIGETLKWNNNTDDSKNGIAKWRIHATKAAFLSATINNNPDNPSGHCYKVQILDEEENPVGGSVEEPKTAHTKTNDLLSGLLVIPAAGDYTIVLKDSTDWSGSVLDGVTLTFVDDIQTLYLKPTSAWDKDGAKFAIWDMTNSAWSHFMTLTENETEIYETLVRASATQVIFARIDGVAETPNWDNRWNQTVDLTLIEGKDLFTITGGSSNAYVGEWSKYEYVEPEVPAKFYIAGSMQPSWDEADWIKVTEDSYTFENLPAGNYQMKIVDGENWLGFSALTEEGRAVELYTNQTGDVCFTLAEAGDVTITYKAGEVFKVEGTFALPTVQLIGIKGEGEAAWDAEHNAVTLVPAENKLTASATITLSGNREFKVICADAWLGKVTEGDEYVLNREVTSVNGLVYGENIPAIIIAPDMLNEEYTFTWTYATGELSVAFPALPKFYITGDAALVGVEKAWHADAIKVTEDSYTFENLPAGAYKLKVTLDGTWGDGKVKGVDNLTVRPAGIQDLNGNIGFILAEAGDVTVTYTAETFTVEGAFVNTPIYMTYFATTGWAGDDASSAVWDATNKKIDVTIAQVKVEQWQGQVWFQSGKPSQADKLYDVSLKIKANKNIGGVIAKYQNGDLTIFSESFNLEADVAYELEMTDQIGKADGDGFLIFDFGYAPAETSIEIYDIEIVEKDAPVLPDLADGFYLIGRINGEEAWNIYGLVPNSHFAPNPGTPEFMLDTTLAIGDEIQVVNVLNKAITAWFPGGDGNNFVIDAWHAGQKTIYFRPDKAGGDDWHHGCIYIAPNEPEVTYSNFEIDLRNGQLGTEGVNMQKYLTVGDEYVYSDEMPLAYNAVLKAASYNGNQHGYIAFVATIPVTAGIYKITLGNCQYNIGTDKPAASVKNEADNALTLLDKYGHSTTAISAIDDCYHNGTTTHITSAWLVVEEAQTIKIVGAKYTPYIKVQKVESVPGLVNVVKFANDEDAEGILPDEQIVEPGESITLLAVNRLLYKAGHTLTGWTDGVETYELGAEFTPTDHTILTAVYSENGANLLTATHDVTVQWDLTKTDGAPAVNWQDREDDFIVTQAIVSGARLDVKLDINTKNNGKFAPTIYWCQVNPVTTFTFPSKKDATLEVYSYLDPASSTLDENAYTGSWTDTDNIATFSTTNVSGTSVYVSKEVNQYYRYFKLTLPKSAATAIDNTGADEKAVKVIENGQILIIKNGKTFNILGAEVK